MNASYLEKATEIDYFITNVEPSKITPEWIVNSYSNRNWVIVNCVYFNRGMNNYGL